MFKMAERSCDEKLLTNSKRATKVYSDKQNFRSSLNIASNFILYFVPYRNNQIYKKGQSQRLKWLGQHNNNRGLLKEQTGLTNLQN